MLFSSRVQHRHRNRCRVRPIHTIERTHPHQHLTSRQPQHRRTQPRRRGPPHPRRTTIRRRLTRIPNHRRTTIIQRRQPRHIQHTRHRRRRHHITHHQRRHTTQHLHRNRCRVRPVHTIERTHPHRHLTSGQPQHRRTQPRRRRPPHPRRTTIRRRLTGYPTTGVPPSFNGANHDTSNTPATVEAPPHHAPPTAPHHPTPSPQPAPCTARSHTIERTHPHQHLTSRQPQHRRTQPRRRRPPHPRHTTIDDVCTGYSTTGVPPSFNGANHDTSNTPATVDDATTSRTTNGGSTTPASTDAIAE